jgi:TolA-binding protein
LEYQKVIERYPQGNKVPAALLKQGMAFTALGDTENAKLIFKELLARYPQSTEAKAAAQKLKP